MLISQRNAWVHAAATLIVICAGQFFDVSKTDWTLLILSICLVWMAEALNTAFEYLCDVASPEFHPLVEKSKDIAAGSVLICATGALVIGCMVFIPEIREYYAVNYY